MKSLELRSPEAQESNEQLELVQTKPQKEKQHSPAIEEWLHEKEVLKILRVSKRTLVNYRSKRLLSFSQIGRKIYYKAIDIQAFLDAHHIVSPYIKVQKQ